MHFNVRRNVRLRAPHPAATFLKLTQEALLQRLCQV
jgi:hypothetical protein